MCEIIAYTGKHAAMLVLISGLKKLEYRGYDSSGVALSLDSIIVVRKQSGKVAGLTDFVNQDPEVETLSTSTCGIPAAVALQLFSYHIARIRGCSINQPRNLAKSVTVE